MFGTDSIPDGSDLLGRLVEVVRDKLDPGEPVTMISIPILARGLIALSGGGLEIEHVRGRQIVDLLESDLSQEEIERNRTLAITEALRSPRASAPLSVKRRIWQNLPEGFRVRIDPATKSVLRDDARKSGADPEILFPGLQGS